MASETHPSPEQLAEYARAKLPGSAAEAVADHLERCAECEATVSSLEKQADTALELLRRAPLTEAFVDEPECRQAVDRIQALAPQPGSSPEKAPHAVGKPSVLRQLREYRLLEKLGQGGMGTVYKALHTKLDKLVALKVLPAAAMQDAGRVARFEREMKAVGKLEHPNIVRAMDAGCCDETHFLVMEYVDGMDLAGVVKRSGRLRIADACEVIRQSALGLSHADQHALVHRDIKPSNLVLSSDGEVKILDFGLALLQKDRPAGEEATGRGRAMGTLDYMAPEQVRDSHSVDIRADIYSLGCAFYKLLTGQAPFSGPQYENTFDKMMAHLNDPLPPIRTLRPDVPEKLAAVLHRMVAKDRDARYAKPGQVVEDLKPFCPGCDLAGLLSGARKAANALGAGLPTPPKPPAARSPESPARHAPGSDPGIPAGQAEGGVGSPAPSAKPPAPSAKPASAPTAKPKPTASSEAKTPAAPAPAEEKFDPYYQWLGIPPDEQPANYYRLLGVRVFEENRGVIQAAAEQRTVFLRNVALGKHSLESQRLLNEVHQAKICLLTPEDKSAYDARLRQESAAKAAAAPALGAGAPALGVGLPTPPIEQTARSPGSPGSPTAGSGTGRPAGRAEGEVRRPSPSAARPSASAIRRLSPYVWTAAACAAAALLLSVIYIATNKGTVKIEFSDPTAKVEVKIDGTRIEIAGLEEPLRLSVGEHALEVTSGEFQTATDKFVITRGGETPVRVTLIPKGKPGLPDASPLVAGDSRSEGKPVAARGGTAATLIPSGPAPPLAVAPFDEKKAKEHQAAWAKHLGVPVEFTNSIGMKLVLIPPGEFMMGATQEEIAWYLEQINRPRLAGQPQGDEEEIPWDFENPGVEGKKGSGRLQRLAEVTASEAPPHRVRISRPLYLGACEVTQAQYQQIMGTNPSVFRAEGELAARVSGQDTSRHPVESVSWVDATQFCQRLSAAPDERTARSSYRLPSEAEWEYACRAGTTTRWSFGDDDAAWHDYAWCSDRDTGAMPHPVGQKRPNAWGLYDMHGNVREWCMDWFAEDYYGSSPTIDPTGPSAGKQHVMRGGEWRGHVWQARSARRVSTRVGQRYITFGFRVACDVAGPGTDRVALESPSTPVAKPQAVPLRPFDIVKAKEEQQAWAKKTGLPVDQVNKAGIRMTLITPGTFVRPQRARNTTFRIAEPFYLGVYEVTQEQYQKVTGANPSSFSAAGKESGRVAGVDTRAMPVETVSWIEAAEFCNRLSQSEGLAPYYRVENGKVSPTGARSYCLPSPAAWIYAATAGKFPEPMEAAGWAAYAWSAENSGDIAHPVGQKQPTGFGLFDTFGNVSEYCGRPAQGRGFSFRVPGSNFNREITYGWPARARGMQSGFRVARVLSPQELVQDKLTGAPSPGDPAAERKAAEWALSVGARLTVELDGSEWKITTAGELPTEWRGQASVDLGTRPVDDEGLKNLAEMKSIRRLVCRGDRVTEAGLSTIAGLNSLEDLNLDGVPVTDAGMAQLARLKNLRSFTCSSSSITERGFQHLAALESLERLNLSRSSLRDPSLKQLGALKHLRVLWLLHTEVGDAGLREIASLKQLTELNLAVTQYTDAGLEHIARLTNLRRLVIGRNPRITDRGLEHLKSLTNLEDLVCSGNRKITKVGIAQIASLTRLQYLDLNATQLTDSCLDHIETLQHLRGLGVSLTKITDAGVERLAKLPSLELLHLRGTQVSDAAIEHLTKATNLRNLLLIGTKVTPAGVLKLKAALPRCRINVGRPMQAEIDRLRPASAAEEFEEMWDTDPDESEDAETNE